ncbi:hypothetical protein H7X46_12180 [Pseudonocardia sp. C8]|uniref:hypothetical protein n=1 Tax=Pseudonocardia sp. C8 TaxID=2762759 RepID=UPI00164265B6|nr:hypothetical protein [Pseudonocardia sp. C8]MBC3191821.1 hypothetical protein [Pseudonocardia sp. C8]
MIALPEPSTDLDEQVAAFRRRRLSRFAPDTLLWLAALPEWTGPLAAAAGFPPPPDPTPLGLLLDRLEAAGLLTRRDDVDTDGRTITAFWLPGSVRGEVGELLRAGASTAALTDRLRALADILRGLPSTHTQLRPWLRVLDQLTDVTGGGLLDAVDDLVAHDRTTEALSTVGSAQALADLLGGPLGSATRRARWRIDRAYREALDARSLTYYLSRSGLEESIGRLLGGDGSMWALHLLGDGGVGKTMAIRDLCSGRFATRAGMSPFPIARIDFDHIDPRYPEDRPGELLAALAGELAPYNTTREAEYRYRHFDDVVARLHEASTDPGTGDVAALLDDSVEAFTGYVLAFGGLVVLVLDTCEELAKLHPPGGRSAAVDATFAMLERIHDRAPVVRVVLAGRRWLVPPPDGAPRHDLVLEPRPYLGVEPLGGFDPDQVQAYLELRDPRDTVSPALRAAIVERSTIPGSPTVNPFEVAGYCDWALAEPDLDAEQLRTAAGDPYVEQRIIARLPSSTVRDSLPAAVELGRFDRSLIGPELHRRGIDADGAFSGLAAQEWVSAVTFDESGRPHTVEIDGQLRPRLRAVIAAHPQRFPLDRARLGADMAAYLRAGPMDEPGITALETAIRLLPVHDLGTLWDELERRIVAGPAAWSWAEHATARAAAAELARATAEGPTILAAIHATQAAAVTRRGRPGRTALWDQVARHAGRHPDPIIAALLAFRALCARTGTGDPAAIARLSLVWSDRPVGADDSAIAAFEELSRAPTSVPAALRVPLDELCTSATRDIAASARLIRAWQGLSRGDLVGAVADVERALALTDAAPVEPHRYAHWGPPPGLRHRPRLARIVLAMARGEELTPLPLDTWRSDALTELSDIDAERLASATITARLAWHPVDPGVVAQTAGVERYTPRQRPTSPWHAAVPSLQTTVARATAAVGDPSAAAAALRERREQAVADGEDPATIADCESALIGLCRQFRTTSFTSSVHRMAWDGTGQDRLDAWATLALVKGESPREPADAGDWATWLRSQIAPIGRIAEHPPPPGTSPVDRLEYALCHGQDVRDLAAREPALFEALTRAAIPTDHGQRRGLASALRVAALCGWPTEADTITHGQPDRAVAEAALAEGELLSLRLPVAAIGLLRLAADRATAAGDPLLAGRAATLRVLCCARAGVDAGPVPATDRVAIGALLRAATDATGWADRAELAVRLLDGGPLPRATGPSPELRVDPPQDPVGAAAIPVESASPGWPPSVAGPMSGLPAGLPPPPARRPRSDAPAPPARLSRPGRPWVIATVTATLVLSAVLVVLALRLGVASSPPSAPSAPTTAPAPTTVPVPTGSNGATPLSIAVIVLVLAGSIVLLVRALPYLARGWAHLRRPRMDQLVVAITGSGDRLECRLRATSGALVLDLAGAAARRPAATRSIVVLLAPRRGGSPDPYATSGASPPSPLGIRFRQAKPPVTWQVWPGPVARGTSIGSDYRGPWHLVPEGHAARAGGEVRPRHRVTAVQHLIGVPVPTSAGVRFRVAGGAPAQGEYQRQGRGTFLGDELVGPDDLTLDNTALVVLQAEPVDGPPRRLDEQYEGMVDLAAEFRDAGAGAVLVVPPLPDTVAADVASACWSATVRHGHRTHPVHIVDLALDVRARIAAASNAAGGAPAERDVLLFANARRVTSR